MIVHAWQILVVTLAGWLNRQQQDLVEYLQEENRVLCEHLKGKRIRFTDDQRRGLSQPVGRSLAVLPSSGIGGRGADGCDCRVRCAPGAYLPLGFPKSERLVAANCFGRWPISSL